MAAIRRRRHDSQNERLFIYYSALIRIRIARRRIRIRLAISTNRLLVTKKLRRLAADLRRATSASWLDAADRLQPRARMDFGLRQHRGLRTEALHQRAHERTHRCGGNQHW